MKFWLAWITIAFVASSASCARFWVYRDGVDRDAPTHAVATSERGANDAVSKR